MAVFTFIACWLLAAFFVVGCIAQEVVSKSFSCNGRGMGYYADVSSGCQVYHMCDGLGRQFSYKCPNATLFQQRMLICDHWYMVNCSRSENDYSANLLIGQKEKPFLDNADYRRTPRPDLLHTSETEYNIIYRSGNDQTQNNRNVVGAEQNIETTQEYFPPSHWSTEIETTTSISPSVNSNRRPSSNNYYRTTYNTTSRKSNKARGKSIDLNSANKNFNGFGESLTKCNKDTINTGGEQAPANIKSTFKATTQVFSERTPLNNGEIKPNFKSNFKATTPVYPTSVEATSEHPEDAGLLPPIPYLNFKSNAGTDTEDELQHVNFESRFNATTPNYPLSVEATSPDPGEVGLLPPQGTDDKKTADSGESNSIVNFQSRYKATTPVYPTAVEPTSPDPGDAGLLPPQSIDNEFHVNFQSKFKATTPVYPKSVEPTSPDPNQAGLLAPEEIRTSIIVSDEQKINFLSKFKATTPNYPLTVDATSPDPGEVGLLPPQTNFGISSDSETQPNQYPEKLSPDVPSLSSSFEPPKIDETGIDRKDVLLTTILVPPIVFYQPPRFHPDYTLNSGPTDAPFGDLSRNKPGNFILTMKPEQLKDLRQMFHIPDYEFPLDSASRPSYNARISSFDAKREKKR